MAIRLREKPEMDVYETGQESCTIKFRSGYIQKFKKENGRLPETTSNDAWEKKMAEGMNAYARLVAEAEQNG